MSIFWRGVDIRTYDAVTLWDSPLRLTLGIDRIEYPAETIVHMAVATSSYLGTAAVLHVNSGNGMVIEATTPDAIAGGTYRAALRAATEHIREKIELDRAWADESARSDELIIESLRRRWRT